MATAKKKAVNKAATAKKNTPKPQAPKKPAANNNALKANGKLVIVNQLANNNALVGMPAQYLPADGDDRTTATVLPAQVYAYAGKGLATLVVYYGNKPKLQPAELLTDSRNKTAAQWQLIGA